MTNYEKIKAMSVEEMSQLFNTSTDCCNKRGELVEAEEDSMIIYNNCMDCPFFGTDSCTKNGFIQWLKSEAEEDG